MLSYITPYKTRQTKQNKMARLDPTPVSIVTITALGYFSQVLKDHNYNITIINTILNKGDLVFEGDTISFSHTQFGNCIICKWNSHYGGKRCVKVFASSLHITGTKNKEETVDIYHYFCNVIFGMTDTNPDIRIVMINSSFMLSSPEPLTSCSLNLMDLYDACQDYNKHTTAAKLPPLQRMDYDMNKHPGIKFYLKVESEPKNVAMFVFSSGKAIITGARSLESIDFVYTAMNEYISNVLQNVPHKRVMTFVSNVHEKVIKKRGRRRKADSKAFYDLLADELFA